MPIPRPLPRASRAPLLAAGAAAGLVVALTGGGLAQADTARADAATTTAATHTASTTRHAPAAPPFTAATYGGHDPSSFDGITVAGTGTPGDVVIVWYEAPGTPGGLVNRHIAVDTSGSTTVGASGRYRFTADFPDLPEGATSLSWHARLSDPDTLSVVARVDGVRALR